MCCVFVCANEMIKCVIESNKKKSGRMVKVMVVDVIIIPLSLSKNFWKQTKKKKTDPISIHHSFARVNHYQIVSRTKHTHTLEKKLNQTSNVCSFDQFDNNIQPAAYQQKKETFIQAQQTEYSSLIQLVEIIKFFFKIKFWDAWQTSLSLFLFFHCSP